MSDLTIKHAGVSVAGNSAGSSISTGKRKLITINPTLSAAAHGAGEVLFNSTELPDAVREEGGIAKLVAITWVLETAVVSGGNDLELVFSEKAMANLGTQNSAPNITQDNFIAANPVGMVHIDSSDNDADFGAIAMGTCTAGNGSGSGPLMFLKADAGSTSVYVSGLAGSGIDINGDSDATSFRLIFHIEY